MRFRIVGSILALVAAVAFVSADQNDAARTMLEAARKREVVDGDLNGAIRQYKAVADKFKSDRAVAATALVRMAECYEKLGDAEARKIYERLVREFTEQQEVVTLARARLGAEPAARQTKGDRPVWTGPKVDGFGTVSVDGRFLTYVDWLDTGNLVLHDLVLGTDRLLTDKRHWSDEKGSAEFSAISKDGRHVAYEWFNKQRCELRIASLQGSGAPAFRRVLDHENIVNAAPYDWSPDGKWLAVHLKRKDLTGQVALLAVQDGALRVLKSVDWKGPTKIFFSPDGRYIAYDLSTGDTSSERDIFVMAIDGSRESVAVAHPSQNVIMGWAPDGKHLLFASDRSGSMGLWILPWTEGKPKGEPTQVKPDIGSSWSLGLTGSGALYVWKHATPTFVQVASIDLAAGRLLPNSPGAFQRFIESTGRPDWSADGKQLAYASCGMLGGGPCTIGIRSDTGQIRELRPRLAYFFFPRWSPDGHTFVTTGNDLKGRHGIYQIDAQSGEVSTIAAAADGQVGGLLQWSRDGKSIFYRWVKDAGSHPIVERDIASGRERPVMSPPWDGSNRWQNNFAISPDWKHIAAILTDANGTSLLVLPFGGSESRSLLRVSSPETLLGAQVSDPAWTPDSRALLVMKGLSPSTDRKELWVVPIDGSKPRKLDIDVDSWLIPGGGFRLSPDGRQIAFVAAAGKPGLEIWALENFLPARVATK